MDILHNDEANKILLDAMNALKAIGVYSDLRIKRTDRGSSLELIVAETRAVVAADSQEPR
jgi:hypothetical protein